MPRLSHPLKVEDYALSFEEVAQEMGGVTHQAVNHCQQRALAKLRKRLNAMGFFCTQDLLDEPEFERRSVMARMIDD